MPLTFTHQNEHPSWATQFGRQLLQMLAQGVIGGGTNLLQGAIMQGIKNRDASTENQKQREFMGGMQEDKMNAIGDIQRQRDMTEQIAGLRSEDRYNRAQEQVAPEMFARKLEGVGDVGEGTAVRSQGRNWASPKDMAQTAPAAALAGASEVAPMASFFPRPPPANLSKEGFPGRAREYWQGLPDEMKNKADDIGKTAFQRDLAGRMALQRQKSGDQMEAIQQRLANQILQSVFKGDMTKRQKAWEMAQDLVRKSMGETPESLLNEALPNPAIPQIPGARYQPGPQPTAPIVQEADAFKKKWGLK
jgi:hypothetical protein